MRVEDDPSPKPRQRDFTLNDWAKWNGTSFAAPKIAALIANEVGVRQFAGINVAGAWAAVQAAQGVPSGRMQVGRIFNV
jgi:hypothetical protein